METPQPGTGIFGSSVSFPDAAPAPLAMWRWRRFCNVSLFVGVLLVLSAVLPAGAADPAPDLGHLPGITYQFRRLAEPRPLRIHILRVDLSGGNLELTAAIAPDSPQEERDAIRTNPRRLAAHPRLAAFVNTNPWAPWHENPPTHVKITGLAATGGEVRSPPDERRVSVWTDAAGRVFIGHPAGGELREGVGGFRQIVKDGATTVSEGGAIHPRTAIGVDREGTRVCLVVVEGRNPGVSEGMQVGELAVFMRDELGCRDAANMDGGGSSVLGIVDRDGNLQVLDGAPGRFLRPLPVMLTVRHRASRP